MECVLNISWRAIIVSSRLFDNSSCLKVFTSTVTTSNISSMPARPMPRPRQSSGRAARTRRSVRVQCCPGTSARVRRRRAPTEPSAQRASGAPVPGASAAAARARRGVTQGPVPRPAGIVRRPSMRPRRSSVDADRHAGPTGVPPPALPRVRRAGRGWCIRAGERAFIADSSVVLLSSTTMGWRNLISVTSRCARADAPDGPHSAAAWGAGAGPAMLRWPAALAAVASTATSRTNSAAPANAAPFVRCAATRTGRSPLVVIGSCSAPLLLATSRAERPPRRWPAARVAGQAVARPITATKSDVPADLGDGRTVTSRLTC